MYLERLYGFSVKIKLLRVDIRLWVAGADSCVVPARRKTVARLKLRNDAVLCLAIKFKSGSAEELPLLLVVSGQPIRILDINTTIVAISIVRNLTVGEPCLNIC